MPLLLLFGDYKNKQIMESELYYSSNIINSINNKIKRIYIVNYKEDIKQNESNHYDEVYYDTEKNELYSYFKVYKCCGSNIILSKDHKVRLATLSRIDKQIVLNIIKNKSNEIF
jgi:hypothetical protein